MKITCHSCQAKYTIADEKVAGKTVKIKCKKCGATIVVHGDQDARQPAQTMDPNLVLGAHAGEEEPETRVFGGDPNAPPASTEEWTVNVSDDDQRTMTTAQIVMEYQRGTLTNDSFVWRDGMSDWLAIPAVPELMALMGGGGGPAAVQPEPQFGLGGTMMMDPPQQASPLAARPSGGGAAAAKRAGRAGAVDLFGAQPEAQASAVPAPPAGDKLVGERNENSVLFSLSALTATENAARVQKPEPAPDHRRPSAPRGGQNGGRAGLDDIMNIGGGFSASPMLAPPPLLAPVVEAPPPPPVMQQQPMGAQASFGAPMSYAMPPQPKSKTGLIVGGVIAVLAIGAVAAFFATRSSTPEATANNEQASATAATTAAPPPTQAASAAPSAEATTAAAETSAPATSGAPSAEAKAGTGGPKVAGGPLPPGKDKKEEKAEKKEEKKEEPVAKKEEKKEEPAPTGGGGEFNRSAATSALGAAAGGARKCGKPDGPTGSGRVKVTFAPSGNVTSATVEGPPFAGTAVGGCVAGAFRGAHVPPFEGSPVSVTKSFSIN